jgi:hypothetical protein
MSLTKNVKITRVSNAAVAAQTAIESNILDMAGFDGVLFVALLADVSDGSVLGLAAEQNDANSGSGMAALAGAVSFTAGATNADHKMLVLDVYKPRERYLRAKLTRTTADAAVSGILALQYGAKSVPTSHDAAVIASALLNDPAPA